MHAIPSCFSQTRNHAWNHGDFQNDIIIAWLGLVGPGVREAGQVANIFTDHTDIRPTILSLTQLNDDYAHDGRVIFEILADRALAVPLRGHTATLARLADAYKQINAPTGTLGLTTLTGISTQALQSTDPATYAALEAKITDITNQRNAIASQMMALLEGAAFQGQKIDEGQAKSLIAQAQALLDSLSSNSN